jgi:membrane associated rhomboid family serine protease
VCDVTRWVRGLIIANVIVFFLQEALPVTTVLLEFAPRYALTMPWTIVTYMFVHSPTSITHILFNMIALFFFGPQVEARIGSKRFAFLYFVSGICGAILSFFFAFNSAIIGASGAVFGVMLAFARYWPTAQILIFGIIPIEARLLVVLTVIFSLWCGFHGSQSGVADFAHLGGFLGGYLYLKFIERTQGARKFRSKTTAKVAPDTLRNWKRVDPTSIHSVNRDEVNRILDKISAKGLGSLTPQERLFLSNFVPPDDRVPPVS